MAVAPPRRGPANFVAGYLAMLRFELTNLRVFLIAVLVIQILIGAGAGIMYGFYLGDLPETAQTFLVSGIPALALIPIGFVLVPSVISDYRFEDTYDYIWSMPVPRLASAAATFTIFSALALPGTAVALLLTSLAYGVSLSPSLMLIPAVLLTASVATSVGYALGHGIPDPRMVNLLANMIIFLVLMFSPIVVPIELFPGWFAAVHHVLPFWHMANVLRDALTDGLVTSVGVSYAVLMVWTVASGLFAARIITRRD